ncbi:MAG: hypothetical protein NWQ38_00900 [Cellulophaga sp.]|nr:hypothetical protein [Cellulophaga sp.]
MKSKRNLGLIMILCALFLACNTEKKDTNEDKNQEHSEIESVEKRDVKAPEKLISIKEAKDGYDTYTKKRVNIIEASEKPNEDGTKFVASRFGEYDIETVKNYIAFVEQEAKTAGVKVETLRFYFSTYPDKKAYSNKRDIKHPRQNTFFILPTIKVDTINLGFYIKTLSNGKKEAALIRDYPYLIDKGLGNRKTTHKSYASMIPNFNSSTFQDDEQSLIMNLSQMQPPPYPDTDF